MTTTPPDIFPSGQERFSAARGGVFLYLALFLLVCCCKPSAIKAQPKSVSVTPVRQVLSPSADDRHSIGDSVVYPGRSQSMAKNLGQRISNFKNNLNNANAPSAYSFKEEFLNKDFVDHLAKAIRFPTISAEIIDESTAMTFQSFHKYLQETFPRVHSILSREAVNTHSLLYVWKGNNPRKKPLLLLAHMDVVPVEEHAREPWVYPAFAGIVDSGYIWGRGAMDNKSSVIGILEAVETLLSQGYQPERDIYFAFGHDEEVQGTGAQTISALLQERGLKFLCILDEGGSIIDAAFPQLDKPLALIGIAEKGYLTLELSVEGEGGHSSVPSTSDNVVSILGMAIYHLEHKPFKPTLTTPVKQMLRTVSDHMTGIEKFVMGNPTFFAGILKSELSQNAITNSLITTTMAPTMIEAGVKDNVLPTTAKMTLNFRILPGQTVDEIINRVRKVVNDKRVKITALDDASNPPRVTSIRGKSYKTIKKTIEQVFPDVVVAPYLNISTSDSRHYTALSDNILRFVPLRLNEEDSKRFHGNNERISVDTYFNSIRFYHQFIINNDRGM